MDQKLQYCTIYTSINTACCIFFDACELLQGHNVFIGVWWRSSVCCTHVPSLWVVVMSPPSFWLSTRCLRWFLLLLSMWTYNFFPQETLGLPSRSSNGTSCCPQLSIWLPLKLVKTLFCHSTLSSPFSCPHPSHLFKGSEPLVSCQPWCSCQIFEKRPTAGVSSD